MTSAEGSPCKRSVRVQDGNRWKDCVVRVTGEGIYIREKGRKIEYGPVSWSVIWLRGAQAAAMEHVASKPARKHSVSRSLL